MSMRAITSLAVHCAYTPPSMDVCVAEIRRWHRARGFSDVGYHYVIRRNAEVETGRALERPGAHVAGRNGHSVGVCLAGGKSQHGARPEMNYTPQQMQALRKLLHDLLQRFPGAEVMGHRDYPGVSKACPCFDVRQWWQRGGQELPLPPAAQQQPFWPGVEHFLPAEFGRPMHPEFIRLLDRGRKAAGVPFIVERAVSDREALLRVRLS